MTRSINLHKLLLSTAISTMFGLAALSTNAYAVVPNDNNTADEMLQKVNDHSKIEVHHVEL